MSNNQSRYENRDKRRKANLVLNILIAIVSILIVVVAANLFINSPSSKDVSKDSETAQKQESPASGKTEKKSDEDIKDSKKDTSDSEKDSEKSSDSDSKKDDSSSKKDDSDSDSSSDSAGDGLKDAKVTEGGSSSDVEKTYENPDWKAVGTEQTGEHTATYDSSSQDWAEMLKAISYATGVSTDNMTVLWLGNNGSPQDAKGKILDKATGNKYQVTITWVDEKGWKPTKVEKLK
ncbi:putative membrane protein YrrS [Bacillus subtilis]|uniref:YrrS family protein n=1 Tax=Bacillus subtilis TaxID=1423 RepID=UPI001B98A1BE|nr:YrrS family protein [Bacillus subtilis]CAI6276471.1 putative membrane protein YrrS [Bacillus subtilis]CAI6297210.1 putative membrane protein YrrS [Bacillus subtilis]